MNHVLLPPPVSSKNTQVIGSPCFREILRSRGSAPLVLAFLGSKMESLGEGGNFLLHLIRKLASISEFGHVKVNQVQVANSNVGLFSDWENTQSTEHVKMGKTWTSCSCYLQQNG